MRLRGDPAQTGFRHGTHKPSPRPTILGQFDEAIVECRAALRLRSDFPEVHANLGTALREIGSLKEAVTALRKAKELLVLQGRSDSNADEITRELKTTERYAALEERLPAILVGIDQPRDDAERFICGELCSSSQLLAAAARFYFEAFSGSPQLADDRNHLRRYKAARAASLAATE